jgi:hypothetical protein
MKHPDMFVANVEWARKHASGSAYAITAPGTFAEISLSCHTRAAKARDFVYTSFAKR